jgi:uncharacterized protein (DUF2141 family)
MRVLTFVFAFVIAGGVVFAYLFLSRGESPDKAPPVTSADLEPGSNSVPEFQADEGNSAINIEMTEIRNADGEVKLTLFDTDDGYPEDKKSVAEYAFAEIVDGKASASFEGIAAGTYAIIILHDEDKDGDMTFNKLGVPREGVGVSNNAKMSFGPPKWKASKFEVPEGTVTQNIKMTYFF